MASQGKSLNQVGLGEVFETLRVLGSKGLTPDDLMALRQDSKLARSVVDLIRGINDDFHFTESEHHAVARDIMGKNFLGIPESCRYFGVTPTFEDLDALKEIPYRWQTLRGCRDTHVLVADFGLSILQIRYRVERRLFYSYSNAWYNIEAFVKENSKPQWRLIRKSEVDGSISKNLQEQKELLSDTEEVPTARAMVYVIILIYLAKGERMLENMYVRTRSVDFDNTSVHVGSFYLSGLSIEHLSGGLGKDGLGVASARKPDR